MQRHFKGLTSEPFFRLIGRYSRMSLLRLFGRASGCSRLVLQEKCRPNGPRIENLERETGLKNPHSFLEHWLRHPGTCEFQIPGESADRLLWCWKIGCCVFS
jgi:hypothetical protein